MKHKLLRPAVTLAILSIAISARAHNSDDRPKVEKKPNCAGMKNMDHSKMDMSDPVMQAMMKQCMRNMEKDSGHNMEHNHGSSDEHKVHKKSTGDQHSDVSAKATDAEIDPKSGLDSEAAKVVKKFHAALRNGDSRLARSLLADEVTIFEGGRVERSADEYAQHHMQSDMKFLGKMNVEILEHQVQLMGNTAISMARSHTKGKYDGKDLEHVGMETIALEKQGKSWKIKHIHWSH